VRVAIRPLNFDPIEAINEAMLWENNLQPVIVLSESHRAVLAAAIYAVPEPDLGRDRNEGVCSGSLTRE